MFKHTTGMVYSYTNNWLKTISGTATNAYRYDANGNVSQYGRAGTTGLKPAVK